MIRKFLVLVLVGLVAFGVYRFVLPALAGGKFQIPTSIQSVIGKIGSAPSNFGPASGTNPATTPAPANALPTVVPTKGQGQSAAGSAVPTVAPSRAGTGPQPVPTAAPKAQAGTGAQPIPTAVKSQAGTGGTQPTATTPSASATATLESVFRTIAKYWQIAGGTLAVLFILWYLFWYRRNNGTLLPFIAEVVIIIFALGVAITLINLTGLLTVLQGKGSALTKLSGIASWLAGIYKTQGETFIQVLCLIVMFLGLSVVKQKLGKVIDEASTAVKAILNAVIIVLEIITLGLPFVATLDRFAASGKFIGPRLISATNMIPVLNTEGLGAAYVSLLYSVPIGALILYVLVVGIPVFWEYVHTRS